MTTTDTTAQGPSSFVSRLRRRRGPAARAGDPGSMSLMLEAAKARQQMRSVA